MIYLVAKNFSMFAGSAVVAVDVAESVVNSGKAVQPVCLVYDIPEDRANGFSAIAPIKMPHVPIAENYSGKPYARIKYWLRVLQCRLNTLKLKREFKPVSSDLVIFNDYGLSTLNVFYLLKGKCKSVQIVHVSPTFIKKFEDAISINELLELYNKSEALVFVSEAGRKEWLSYGVLDEKKTHYIPNCARESAAKKYLSASKNSARKRLGLKKDRFYLVSVASMVYRKGQDLLIDAAPELKRIAPNLEILLIGSGHKVYTEKLKEQVLREDMNYVSFLGRKSNAMEYVYASDSFILMSRAEALPVVILESMVLKTPVIASDVDGVPEMIENGKTGFIFQKDNVNDLIRSFKKMYQNQQNGKKYAEKASEKYWNNFSKKRFIQSYNDLVDKLTK